MSGDMADWALENLFDPDAQGRDGFDNVPEREECRPTEAPLRRACAYCYQDGLHWQWNEACNCWRLYDANGELHTCEAYQRAQKLPAIGATGTRVYVVLSEPNRASRARLVSAWLTPTPAEQHAASLSRAGGVYSVEPVTLADVDDLIALASQLDEARIEIERLKAELESRK